MYKLSKLVGIHERIKKSKMKIFLSLLSNREERVGMGMEEA